MELFCARVRDAGDEMGHEVRDELGRGPPGDVRLVTSPGRAHAAVVDVRLEQGNCVAVMVPHAMQLTQPLHQAIPGYRVAS
jgi:hypothetical protein